MHVKFHTSVINLDWQKYTHKMVDKNVKYFQIKKKNSKEERFLMGVLKCTTYHNH